MPEIKAATDEQIAEFKRKRPLVGDESWKPWVVDVLLARIEQEKETIRRLTGRYRYMMWISHGHSGLYGDDGEMQCSLCAKHGCYDYKNAPLVEVEAAYRMAILERAAFAAKETV